MDKSRIQPLSTYSETRFRQPTSVERELGLWVDRIGEGPGSDHDPRLRLLGQYAVVMVQDGRGRLETQGLGCCDVEAGDVMLVWPEVPTRYFSRGRWFTRWVVWNGGEAAAWRRLLCWPPLVARGAARAVRLAHLRLAGLMPRGDVPAALERKAVMLNLATALCGPATAAGGGRDPAAAVRVTAEAMAERLEEPWNVASLARQAGLSASQYRRLFRRCTGDSPVDYLRTVRVARAKELLLQGVPIKAAAAQTGYPDVFYFMRVFKQVADMPPGRFARLRGWAK